MIGPRNVQLEAQNLDTLAPPSTDSPGFPFNLKWSFANRMCNWKTEDGRAKRLSCNFRGQANCGLQMRLEAGAVRELHWHKESEWTIVLQGCRVSAVDASGKTFVDDVGPGDLWFFPSGTPHRFRDWIQTALNFCCCSTRALRRKQHFPVDRGISTYAGGCVGQKFGVPDQGTLEDTETRAIYFQSAIARTAQGDTQHRSGSGMVQLQNDGSKTHTHQVWQHSHYRF